MPNSTVPSLREALHELAKEQERRARIWTLLSKRSQRVEYLAWADHERRLAEHARRLALTMGN